MFILNCVWERGWKDVTCCLSLTSSIIYRLYHTIAYRGDRYKKKIWNNKIPNDPTQSLLRKEKAYENAISPGLPILQEFLTYVCKGFLYQIYVMFWNQSKLKI